MDESIPDSDATTELTIPPDILDKLPRWPIALKTVGRKWPRYLRAGYRQRWTYVRIQNDWPAARRPQ
jgi:hypothetical protein